MNTYHIMNKKILSIISCSLVFIFLSISYCQAEILSRSRPEPEMRERIHKILRKTLAEKYIDVSVVMHSVLDNTPVKKDSDLLPGVKIITSENDVKVVFNYRSIILTVNDAVNLDQVEMRIRSEITELKSQDRFEQSVVIEKLQIERPDFSAKLVEYVNLLVGARANLNLDEPVAAQEMLKQAAAISAEFPAGYEMLGVEQLIPEYVPEGTEAITPAQWAIIGTLGVLLLLTLALFFFVSRSTREKEEKEHPLQSTLGKVATAIESMAPETEEEEEELDLPDEEDGADDDEGKIDYFGFVRRMPAGIRVNLLQKIKPAQQAAVFSQMDPGEMAVILKEFPAEDALAAVLAMKDVSVSPSELEKLAEELAETAKKLPVSFDGLGRIGELSGQVSAEQWNMILDSTGELKKKNPDLAKTADSSMSQIRERSLSFDELQSSSEIEEALVARVMERFERSRLSTGARVSVPYLLLDAESSVTEKIMKEYTEETRQYYQEQQQGFEKQREEDDADKERINQLRDLHRNVFMRHVHQELAKIWNKKDS
ncbi:MAG: flagellar motor switch protein FliG [SAR324 cluster bacterium]|nr:flagellar motor switch protein FliG [SAR324 cluster bacterium]MBL7035205.1 flagellar motor switch protein FliG [SAR324 cluster bacterium]